MSQQSEVDRNRQIEEMILRLMDSLRLEIGTDQRWLHIGREYIELGFMALNRAILRPERVKLDDDVPEQGTLEIDPLMVQKEPA